MATYASSKAIGAVLSQKDDNGREEPMQYVSRCLNDAEQNYSTLEGESLAVIFSLKKFRPYLLSDKFTLFTDHQARRYVFNNRDSHERIARWMCLLAEWGLEIQYGPVNDNSLVDYLKCEPLASDLVLTLQVESDLRNVAEYLETSRIHNVTDKKVLRGTKFRA